MSQNSNAIDVLDILNQAQDRVCHLMTTLENEYEGDTGVPIKDGARAGRDLIVHDIYKELEQAISILYESEDNNTRQ